MRDASKKQEKRTQNIIKNAKNFHKGFSHFFHIVYGPDNRSPDKRGSDN